MAHLALLILSAMLLINVVMIKLAEKHLVQTKLQTGRLLLNTLTQKAGYEVIAYANGEEAFERLKTDPFTLLLTDIVMPRMDGIELARRASESPHPFAPCRPALPRV